MLAIVRDNQYVAFTMAPDPSAVHPMVHWFRELAPDWGIENAGRIAAALREVLLKAVSEEGRQGRVRELRCRIERVSGASFKITVDEEASWFDFNFRNAAMQDASRNAYRLAQTAIRRILRNADPEARDRRLTVLVDANGAGVARSGATGHVAAQG